MQYKQSSIQYFSGLNKNKNITQSPLSDLSISEIKAKQLHEQSTDYLQEKQLLQQIQREDPLQEYYGKINFVRKSKDRLKFSPRNGLSYLKQKETASKEKNLYFNKQIKRKKTLSKSKDKNTILTASIVNSNSLAKLSPVPKKNIQSQKQIQQPKTKNIININKATLKAAKIGFKLNQPTIARRHNIDEAEKVNRLYYLLPDGFKMELHDLNSKIVSQPVDQNKQSAGKQAMTQMFSNLKKSYYSGHSIEQAQMKDKPSILTCKSEKIYEVKRPLSRDHKDSSFNSNRTGQYESPISFDSSSTATHRVIRRSEIIQNNSGKLQQYFARPLSKSKLFN